LLGRVKPPLRPVAMKLDLEWAWKIGSSVQSTLLPIHF
jgi:hypothetical protein